MYKETKIIKNIIYSRLFLCSILMHLATASFTQWSEQNSGVNSDLRDVCFVDKLYGWAIGDSGTIINTTDGGDTWVQQICPIDTATLQQVIFINKDTGYILGSKSYQPEGDSFILSTINGGQDWQLSYGLIDYWLTDLCFISADSGWVVGGDFHLSRLNGIILHTTDGGQTWQPQLETHSQSSFTSQMFSAVAFLNHQDGWAFGSDYLDNFSLMNVYRTNDGGQNWGIIATDVNALFEMAMVSPDTIWGGGYSFGKSNDGGLTWEIRYWPVSYISYIKDIVLIDGQTGWLAADYYTQDWMRTSKILHTEDAGSTFSVIFADSSGDKLQAITHHNENFWVVGSAGLILHHCGYPTGVDSNWHCIPQRFDLQQNYPNPFNPSTTIDFNLLRPEFIILKIFNILGEEVASLVSDRLSAGSYTYKWDASNMTSGVYLYRLEVGEYIETKKMLLIR